MKRIIGLILCIALTFGGCSTIFDGYHTSVKAHKEVISEADDRFISAMDYDDLCSALDEMVKKQQKDGVILVPQYNHAQLIGDMHEAIQYVKTANPLGAYAVDNVSYELGTNMGKTALAVMIQYSKEDAQIKNMIRVPNIAAAQTAIAEQLPEYETSIVLYINHYKQTDFAQWVEDYCAKHPDEMIESPKTTVNVYPENGDERVVEIAFSYRTSRDDLREMRDEVRPVFDSATVYVSEEEEADEKYAKLYSFLIDFHLSGFSLLEEVSLTPAYSLLYHGVGDSRAVAMVYAAMCSKAGLECLTVTGTRNGNPWWWNIICIDDTYYHVDLLRSREQNSMQKLTDDQMQGYVWDYTSYPARTEQT